MKQTAVEWLAEKIQEQIDIFCPGGILDDNMIEKAKQMEKEQMKDCYWYGDYDGRNGSDRNFEQYYKETYKSE